MTMTQLRSAASWLAVLDSAEHWRAGFERDKDAKDHPFIEFGEISSQTRADGMGTGRGWEGELILPRAVAVDMMTWLEQRARDELKKLGVKA